MDTPPKYNIGDVLEFYTSIPKDTVLMGVCTEIDDLGGTYRYDLDDIYNPHGKLPRSFLGSLDDTVYEQDIIRKVE